MANRFSSFIKKKILGKNNNLISMDNPYEVMVQLLRNSHVTGILDVGASNGHISKRLLKRFPSAQAYAFEPNPLYTEVLGQYARKDARFHPQLLGLSDHAGDADLYLTESPGNTSLCYPGSLLQAIDKEGASVRKIEKIKITTIDDWIKENGSPEIQLIKLDIQGGELRALCGATGTLSNSALLVYTEILFNPLYKKGAVYSQIDLYLREHEFILYDIYRPKYNSDGLIMWGNAIFVHTARLGM